MGKQRPPGTRIHTLYVPEDVHKQVASVAGYGAADDLIIECLREAMRPRWKKWLAEQTEKLDDESHESKQGTIRPSARQHVAKTAAKNS